MPPPRDITKEFTAAASSLATGELIKDEFFTLAESVGALEIMDPKMDSGYLKPGESLDIEYDFSAPLSAAQVLGLMDQLLCSEAAWQQGHSLAQTVFTCLYIDKLLWPVPRSLAEVGFNRDDPEARSCEMVDVVFRAYCCAVVKMCDLIQVQVTSEQFYEEEDFSGHLYRRELLTRVSTQEIDELLEHAEEAVASMLDIDASVQDGLLHRLRLRRELLCALSVESPKQHVVACISWENSSKLLVQVDQSSKFGVQVRGIFSQKVQRKLASSTPPRPVVEVAFRDAVDHMKRMCDDAVNAFSILDCTTGMNVVNFLSTYMFKRPQPNVYVRCLMQSLIYKEGVFLGKFSNQEFFFRDLSEMILGESIITKAIGENVASEVSAPMHKFAEATAHSFAELARCLCMNRSRTRRMLTHTLNDWENLQFEAEDVDVQIRDHTGEKPLIDRLGSGEEIWSYPLSSWVYTYKLKQMEWIVQMGFELAVYMPDEYSGMYWYLQYLAGTRLQHLTRVQTFAKRSYDLIRKATREQTAAFEKTFACLEFLMTDATAIESFAEALSKLYHALRLAQLIPESPRPYGTDDFRHNLRLKPFLTISLPPVPSRKEVTDAVEGGMRALSLTDEGKYAKSLELLDEADEFVKVARKELDALGKQPADVAQHQGCEAVWRQKTKDVLKSVISTGITIAGVKKALEKAGENRIENVNVQIPEAGSSYHEWWPVPSLKSK